MREKLKYSDYTTTFRKQSSYVENLVVDDYTIMRCPVCSTQRNKIEHGFTTECNKCFLKMQVFGNTLYIWK